MTAGDQSLTARPAWEALEAHHQQVRGRASESSSEMTPGAASG